MNKVSVLIPVYNSEKFLEQCIESVLNQTYENIEIIAVDDGSTDDSLSILRKFPVDKISIISQKNKGACSARNQAFMNSTGDFIQYLDADDYLHPNKLEVQLARLQFLTENDFLLSGDLIITNKQADDVKLQGSLLKDFSHPADWLKLSWLGEGMFPPNVWLSPRSLIIKSGSWNENIHLNQDGDFFARVILHSNKIVYVKNSISYYRKDNPYSISRSNLNSKAKAKSLLQTYLNYVEYAIKFDKLDALRLGLANNFLQFIYIYFDIEISYCRQAMQAFYNLGYKKPWPVGGTNFKKVAAKVGFIQALQLRKLVRSFIRP